MMKYEIYDVMINERYAFTMHVPANCEDIKKYIERRHPSLRNKEWRWE